MSTTTPKHVMFTMEIGETPNPDEHIDHNKLEEMVKELSQSLTGVNYICFFLSTYRKQCGWCINQFNSRRNS